MTALTESRSVPKTTTVGHADPIADGVLTIYRGALCVLDDTGKIRPGYSATGLRTRGISQHNHLDVTRIPHELCHTETGCFSFFNDIDHPITSLDINLPCYILDDQTVTRDSTGRSVAGIVDRLADINSEFSEMVFVRIGV